MCEQITFGTVDKLGFDFVDNSKTDNFEETADEYYFRNIQNGSDSLFRHLTLEEIDELEKMNNTADDWNNIMVSQPFNVKAVRNNRFYGKNRLGSIPYNLTLKFHDLELPVGITNSTVISSDIGDCCAVHDVSYLSHYIVREKCILFKINEFQCTNHSKFGNGFLKEGEDPSVLVEIMVMNENGNRKILPFYTIQVSDAFLWADNPADAELNQKLKDMTFALFSSKRGEYGEVGKCCVIKGVNIIKDVKFGEYCYIKGATKLKNITIMSSQLAPSQIGESCEIVNGIIGYGCKVFYGCKAVRFVMCENSQLKYGARLINSVLGENSTVSCCELISNLIFPFHEQHHNNSFLISALLMGQTNLAAGANIGSNHNSRGADGEMRAGRGFWPALSSTIKYDCNFASFVLLTKGNYDCELNVCLPFSLVAENKNERKTVVMPAYWWLYNMYALERNSDKFRNRDKRIYNKALIETDYLAPDTVYEISKGMEFLTQCCGKIPESDFNGEVTANNIERGKSVRILKAKEAYNAYKEMILYYGIKETVFYCHNNSISVKQLEKIAEQSTENCFSKWINLGGRIVPESYLKNLIEQIKQENIKSWEDVHSVYAKWDKDYSLNKAVNAFLWLKKISGFDVIDEEIWQRSLEKLKQIRGYIDTQVELTRKKDYKNSFRLITYKNAEERDSVLGRFEENKFISQSKEKTFNFLKMAKAVRFK